MSLHNWRMNFAFKQLVRFALQTTKTTIVLENTGVSTSPTRANMLMTIGERTTAIYRNDWDKLMAFSGAMLASPWCGLDMGLWLPQRMIAPCRDSLRKQAWQPFFCMRWDFSLPCFFHGRIVVQLFVVPFETGFSYILLGYSYGKSPFLMILIGRSSISR